MHLSDSRPYKAREETTLSLIEDCLNQIYTVRKRSLLQRKAHHNTVMQNRRMELDSPVHSPTGKGRPVILPFGEEEPDYDAEERGKLVKDLSSKFKAPSAIAQPPIKARMADPIKKPSQNPQAILDNFLATFKEIVSKAEPDDEFDAECEQLTEQFFTDGLDLLPPSAQVSEIRKKISVMIEDLASGDIEKHREMALQTVPPSQQQQQQAPLKPALKKSKSVQFIDAKSSPLASEEGGDVEDVRPAASSAAPVDKGAAEKQRIKQQYENYMKLKRKNDQHKDSQRIKEYESLNEDIKTVLQSIQAPNPLHP